MEVKEGKVILAEDHSGCQAVLRHGMVAPPPSFVFQTSRVKDNEVVNCSMDINASILEKISDEIPKAIDELTEQAKGVAKERVEIE